jgi:hypothetical protein
VSNGSNEAMIRPTKPQNARIDELVDEVRSWSRTDRMALIRELLHASDEPDISVPPMTIPLDQVLGMLKSDGPPPTDEECQRIVEEVRTRRYVR